MNYLKSQICSSKKSGFVLNFHENSQLEKRVYYQAFCLTIFPGSGSIHCTNDLHFTRSLGGIPNFFFLLSVWRLKKYPQVGFSSV